MVSGEIKTFWSNWQRWFSALISLFALITPLGTFGEAPKRVDFDRDVRRILSENCFKCHGPDAQGRKGGKHGMRLDTQEGSRADLGGYSAVVPGHPDKSELVRRISTSDPDDKMPPPDSGKQLTPQQISVLQQWITEGAEYTRHWAYVKPQRPALPTVADRAWPKNAIDHFVLARLEKEGLKPSRAADRHTIIRRVSLDLTGLPPTPAEVDRFVNDQEAGAYVRLVDRLLASPAFGEHWARWWLDQARYADSAGYADDPLRTIWAYRDYVIRSFNANKPFDRFTLEQLAGDLLPEPTEEDLVATGFHRNTLTNNEGGTSDEEFRNVAVVDRVNTTFSVWMATTMGCAQCHDHKYDPLTQEEYFRCFAIFNNTADADRPDESPVLSLFTRKQEQERRELEQRIARLTHILKTSTPALETAQSQWEQDLAATPHWQVVESASAGCPATTHEVGAKGSETAVDDGVKSVVRSLQAIFTQARTVTAVRLEAYSPVSSALPIEGQPRAKSGTRSRGNGISFQASPPAQEQAGVEGAKRAMQAAGTVISKLKVTLTPPEAARPVGRYVRIELPGKERILSLAEVQVFNGTNNLALGGAARQSSTAYEGLASLAIDGNTNGDFFAAKSTTHTEVSENPWWEVDLGSPVSVDKIVIWNRTDSQLQGRLGGSRLALLNERREAVWEQEVKSAPKVMAEFVLGGPRLIPMSAAYAGPVRPVVPSGELPAAALETNSWTLAPDLETPLGLTLIPAAPVEVPVGSSLAVTFEQQSPSDGDSPVGLRLLTTDASQVTALASMPASIREILNTRSEQRTDAKRQQLAEYYRSIAPDLKETREQRARAQKELKDIMPYTTVPVMRELAGKDRRKTHIEHRGNYLDLGKEVTEGLPAAFPALPANETINRLALARWLLNPDNPLTARVVVNRFWEALFGIGIVRTSEDFGTQGDLPSNSELLDWLATEFPDHKWDIKYLLRLMVTSATYRQASKDTPELVARDPDNRLLARGPRLRLSAEMVRDQALSVSGLLSHKMYGPPVHPPQPKLGLSAAFGGGIDWTTSEGEDRYRRAIYTAWRRSNPYPSMATFDAPTREVCVVRRVCSNTPLQALVTLNDPVYVEAAQALARRMAENGKTPVEKVQYGFRLCLARLPTEPELKELLQLYGTTYARMAGDLARATKIALPKADSTASVGDIAELATWTVVGNVLLNLDEFLMKP